jgi:hypothetical protein
MDFNYLDRAEEIIHRSLTGIISEDDYSEIRAKKQEGARFTQTTFQTFRFKKILHANDAGLEIYLKKFGKSMAAAIEDAAFGAEPALNKESNPPAPDVASPSDTNPGDGSGITWTNEAEQYLLDAPGFIRKKIRTNAEEKANKLGVRVIDRQFVENLRKNEH